MQQIENLCLIDAALDCSLIEIKISEYLNMKKNKKDYICTLKSFYGLLFVS